MKLLLGFLTAFLLVVLGPTVDAQAQTYPVGNNSFVIVCVTIQTTCGPIGPICVPAGTVVIVAIPPGCVVTGVWYQSILYSVGYSGPVPPPNPPNQLQVTPGRAVFF